MSYEPNPCYPPVGGGVGVGWDEPVDALPDQASVLAVDGPAAIDWDRVIADILGALDRRGLVARRIDVRDAYLPWPEILALTSSSGLVDDPDFDRIAGGTLADLFGELPATTWPADVAVIFGPGASLVPHDLLWYVDLPKRFAEAEISAGRRLNLGQRGGDGAPTTKRLLYIDWPMLDRHRDKIVGGVDRWVDLQDLDHPRSVDGDTMRASMAALAYRPFRTRPTFNSTPWGGRWGQRTLGFNSDAPNTALGYELIAPESGVLIGDPAAAVELPFQMITAAHPPAILGPAVEEVFGTSFPIRFDYLDTVDGGNLSVHCHPQASYMAEVFGWPYPQHETYYLMVGGEGSRVFLGLRDDVDVQDFHRRAHAAEVDGEALDIERYVQVFPAKAHQLFCVPAGTPHGSGVGNVVLEISATPYLYSLRFYDWLRRDADGRQRPVHVEHAFANLDADRTGASVRADLVQSPRVLREGSTWREDLLGSLPEMFFEVRRLELSPSGSLDDDTSGRFHVLNVVEGDGVAVEPLAGIAHDLRYAETLVVPAAVGAYRVRALGSHPVRVVKALVS